MRLESYFRVKAIEFLSGGSKGLIKGCSNVTSPHTFITRPIFSTAPSSPLLTGYSCYSKEMVLVTNTVNTTTNRLSGFISPE